MEFTTSFEQRSARIQFRRVVRDASKGPRRRRWGATFLRFAVSIGVNAIVRKDNRARLSSSRDWLPPCGGFSFSGVDSLCQGRESVIDLFETVGSLLVFPIDKNRADPDIGANVSVSLGATKRWGKGGHGAAAPVELTRRIVSAVADRRVARALAAAFPLLCVDLENIDGADEVKGRTAHIDIGAVPDSLKRLEKQVNLPSAQSEHIGRRNSRHPVLRHLAQYFYAVQLALAH